MDYEEDTYTTIFRALKHPIRRKILHMLDESSLTYTNILNELGVETGFLNYHLESLNSLIKKENNKYQLSDIGRASMHLTTRLENKVEQEPRSFTFLDKKYHVTHLFIPVTLILLILTGGSYLHIRTIRAEQASNLEYEITLCRASMNIILEKFNQSLFNNFIDIGNIRLVEKETERISVRLETIMFLDKKNANEWMQISIAINRINTIARTLEDHVSSYDLLQIGMNNIQHTRVAYMRDDLNDLKNCAFPDLNEIDNYELNRMTISKHIVEVVTNLEESTELVRLAFNLPIPFMTQ
jgi:DNA-binding transcriptional ArsR family regulator